MSLHTSTHAIEIGKWMAYAIKVYDQYPQDLSSLALFIRHLNRIPRENKIDAYVDTKVVHEFERRFGLRSHRGLWTIEWAFVKGISYQYFFLLLHDMLLSKFTVTPHMLGDDIDKNAYFFPVDLIRITEQIDLIHPNHILKSYEESAQTPPPSTEGSQRVVHPKKGKV